MSMVRQILIGASLVLSAMHAHGQAWNGDATLFPEQAEQDVLALRALLDHSHPAPYRYVSKDSLDALFISIMDSMARPVTVQRFEALVTRVFHAVGDANCRPVPAPLPKDARLLPLRVVFADSVPIVLDEPKGFRSIPRGSVIRSINGVQAADIVARMAPHIVADGANRSLRRALIASDFAAMYHRYVDRSSSFMVTYTDPKGEENEVLVMGMTTEEVTRSQRPSGVDMTSWGSTMHPDVDALWLRVRTLDPAVLAEEGLKPDRYLEALRKEMRRNDIRTLVIDVRGASGHDPAMAEQLFGLIAQRPYRVLKDMTVRSRTPPEHYPLAVPRPGFYAMAEALFLPADGHGPVGLRSDDPRLDMLPAPKKAFDGKVYVVCDGLTRDAAAAFVMLAKRTRRARIVGEETGSNAAAFNGGHELLVRLPHSGIQVVIPLVRYVPEGEVEGPEDRGEMPHHTVTVRPEVVARGGDTVKEALLGLIRELR